VDKLLISRKEHVILRVIYGLATTYPHYIHPLPTLHRIEHYWQLKVACGAMMTIFLFFKD